MQYQWKQSKYNIIVKNPNGKNGIEDDNSKILLNGNQVGNSIKLDGSRNDYNIEVIL